MDQKKRNSMLLQHLLYLVSPWIWLAFCQTKICSAVEIVSMKLCVGCIKCAPKLRNSWSCRLQPAVLSPTAVCSNLMQLLDRPWIHLNIFHNYFSSLQNIFTIYLVICFSLNICYCRFWLFCRNQELLGHTHHILFQLLNRIKNIFASS